MFDIPLSTTTKDHRAFPTFFRGFSGYRYRRCFRGQPPDQHHHRFAPLGVLSPLITQSFQRSYTVRGYCSCTRGLIQLSLHRVLCHHLHLHPLPTHLHTKDLPYAHSVLQSSSETFQLNTIPTVPVFTNPPLHPHTWVFVLPGPRVDSRRPCTCPLSVIRHRR